MRAPNARGPSLASAPAQPGGQAGSENSPDHAAPGAPRHTAGTPPFPAPPRNALVVDVCSVSEKHVVRRLARHDSVVQIARDRSMLNSLVADIWDAGGRIVAITDDDLDLRPLSRIVRDAESRFGPLDVIVGSG